MVGLLIAGSCFILPAMLIVWALAAVYVRYQTVPEVGWLLYGIKPVIIAIVVQALWKLGKSALKDRPTIVAGVAVAVLFFLDVNEILLLLLAGLGVMLFKNRQRLNGSGNHCSLAACSRFTGADGQFSRANRNCHRAECVSVFSQDWFGSVWKWLCPAGVFTAGLSRKPSG